MSRYKHKILPMAIVCMLFIMIIGMSTVSAAEAKKGKVTASKLNVRTGAGVSHSQLNDVSGEPIQLLIGHELMILETIDTSDATYKNWSQISFVYNTNTYQGYVYSNYITEVQEDVPETNVPQPDNVDFEIKLAEQGFPESYKKLLRKVHEKYPNWEFKALQTNLNWKDVVTAQSKLGRNLISNSKNDNWKSIETGAYNWLTNKYTVYDGTTWVAPSSETVAYYLDPRNYLTENLMFQFEDLSYAEKQQKIDGIKSILKGTFMSGKTVTHGGVNYAYENIFVEAAKYSKVSPYHLAARVKQEVGVNGSISTTGKYAGYEGYYNFYNIGATHSTTISPAVNGLKYAKDEAGTNAAKYPKYMLPWNNQYKAIVGGSQFIGSSYISIGQDTLYFQKFDFVGTLYTHQYMANIEAPLNEGKTVYNTYKNISMLEQSMAFTIPVFNNMPSAPAPAPANLGNPNNYLKTLTVNGYSLTPTFDPAITQTYTVLVGNGVSSVNIAATTIVAEATVAGTGKKDLKEGNNNFTIKVTAQNGKTREYKLIVYREVPKEAPVMTIDKYVVTNTNKLTGVDPLTSVSDVIKQVSVTNGQVRVMANNGSVKSSGNIATGDKLQLLSNAGGVVKEYVIIIYGDVNGDGNINVADIQLVQNHVLGRKLLTQNSLIAGDANKFAGKIDVADLIVIKKHLLGINSIKQ